MPLLGRPCGKSGISISLDIAFYLFSQTYFLLRQQCGPDKGENGATSRRGPA
jgi:hypothetical protein